MAEWIKITTKAQAEEALKANPNAWLNIIKGKFSLKIEIGSPWIKVSASAEIDLVSRGASTLTAESRETSTLRAESWETSTLRAVSRGASTLRAVSRGASTLTAESRETSTLRAVSWETSTLTAVSRGASTLTAESRETSTLRAESWETSTLRAVSRGASTLRAVSRGASTLTAESRGASTLTAVSREASTLTAESREASTLTAESRETSTLRAVSRGASTLRAESWGASTLTAVSRETSTLTAESREASTLTAESREASTLTAESRETSTLRAESWGYSRAIIFGNITLKAALTVSVIRRDDKSSVNGGHIQNLDISTPEKWCEYYGLPVVEGVVTLFKGVDDDYSTDRARPKEIFYRPGDTPSAPDWDGGKIECGAGLHASPSPGHTLEFNSSAKHFMGVPVRLEDISVHPNGAYPQKVKFSKVCAPCFEVDRDGKPVEVAP